jgi:hypothetical protein
MLAFLHVSLKGFFFSFCEDMAAASSPPWLSAPDATAALLLSFFSLWTTVFGCWAAGAVAAFAFLSLLPPSIWHPLLCLLLV